MSADITTLMQQVYDYFLGLFQQRSSSTPGSTFLAFEPIGTPITPDMFKLHSTDTTYSPALAVEQFSSLVNTIPDINADVFRRTDKQVDDFYQILLAGSLPVNSNNALFSTMKSQAAQKFDNTLGSLLEQFVQFHPSYATPRDWYDPSIDGNWATYTFNSGQSTSTGEGTPPPPPIRHPIRSWDWRVVPEEAVPALENQQLLVDYMVTSERKVNPAVHISPELLVLAHPELDPVVNPVTPVSPKETTLVSPETVEGSKLASPGISVESSTLASPHIAVEKSTLVSSAAVEDSIAAIPSTVVERAFVSNSERIAVPQPQLVATELTPLINKYTSAKSVTSSTLSVTFKYCLINIDRPWFSQAFLSLQNWYAAGYQAGAFSSGAAENNSGVFPTLPVACLVIKDLRITAQWTEEDTIAIQRAAAFGPFSLVGRAVDSTTTTLIANGMQAMGWICQVMLLLPPASAPAS
jgi:hypothetical protein